MTGRYDDMQAFPDSSAAPYNVAGLNDHKHAYLGDLEDQHAAAQPLDVGTSLMLPVINLNSDNVLLPGELLPLWLLNSRSKRAIEATLKSDNRIFAAATAFSDDDLAFSSHSHQMIGCTAEIQRLRKNGPRLLLVARGCQRITVLPRGRSREGFDRAEVKVLPFGEPHPMGSDVLLRAAFPSWVVRQGDAYHLVQQTFAALHQKSPEQAALVQAGRFWGPEKLSFRLMAMLPISSNRRLQLSQTPLCAERLSALLDLIRSPDISMVKCRFCEDQIGTLCDVLPTAGGLFVNPHGYMHDLVVISEAHGVVSTVARYATESWFPGYAWDYASCVMCSGQAGWRFTCIADHPTPGWPVKFYAIRRDAIA